MEDQIKQLREQINQLDQDLIAKLAERLAAVKQIGEIKKQLGLQVTDLGREQELKVIHQTACQKNGLAYAEIEALFQLIIALSKKIQQ